MSGRTGDLHRLAARIAAAFLENYLADGVYRRDAIAKLCILATSGDDGLSRVGQHVIFSHLVERLSDSFDSRSVALYDRMFAQIIEFCRRLPAGKPLDAMLGRFGMRVEQDLLDRKKRIKRPAAFPRSRRAAVKKIFVLSRVTLGAEVAVTSLILKKMKEAFPGARVVLLAHAQMKELLGGDAKITIQDVPYARHGRLLERLQAWIDLVRALDHERRGLLPGEYLIVDPDSRLTQLGLLPVTDGDAGYYFFESRSFKKPALPRIGQLTVRWLTDLFGPRNHALYPYVSLLPEHTRFGRDLSRRVRLGGGRHIVTVSFGVGDNARKRVSDAFETELLFALLDEGSRIVLDKGIGEEVERANKIIGALRGRGKKVTEAKEGRIRGGGERERLRCDVLAWQGGVGAFSSLIAASDLYVGYDSAFQHVAAALGVPVIDIFADLGNPLFVSRWEPYARGPVKTVKTGPPHENLLARVLGCHREIKRRPRTTRSPGKVSAS
jgi:ADP-heptose:LPS heptosyltransferase